VQYLAFAIPPIANWRHATLPRSLSESDIVQFLRSFDRAASSGKRAYAMARCLTDLGLRANEVARLLLEDIDWYNGIIRVTGNKSRRTDVLPLPLETGRAIAPYLTTERPTTANRAVSHHMTTRSGPVWCARSSSRRSGDAAGHIHMSTYSGTARPAGFSRRTLR